MHEDCEECMILETALRKSVQQTSSALQIVKDYRQIIGEYKDIIKSYKSLLADSRLEAEVLSTKLKRVTEIESLN